MIASYGDRHRAGVTDFDGVEVYFIAGPCKLVFRLLRTAKDAATHSVYAVPSEVGPDEMLLAAIHRKVTLWCG